MTIEELRAVALALPTAVEVPTWEDTVTFRVRNKIFARCSAATPDHVSIKANREDQAELVAADPDTFAPAPYVGRFGWIRADLRRIDPDELRDLVVEAWRRTAPKKLAASYDVAAEPS